MTDGKPFGKNTWYGRVTASGAWEPGKNVAPETMTALRALLTAFAANPAGVAADHGRLAGLC